MKFLTRIFGKPWFHLLCIQVVIAIVFWRTNVVPQDDHGHYSRFIDALANGRLDLSIPGFQGSSFLATPFYLLMPVYELNAYFQIACAFLLPLAAYFAAKHTLRDRLQSVLFAYAMALMPFFYFMAFQGFTFASFTLLSLITIGLRGRGSAWAWLPWAFAILTKPFAIALLPLFLFWKPTVHESFLRKGWVQILLMLPIPAAYVIAQYFQVGHIIVGAHPEITQSNVFLWWRAPLNAAHGVQMLFSVHNFYFPDPSKTGQGNLVHSSPILMLLGVFSLLYPRQFWKDIRLARAIGVAFLIAYTLAALLDHMDHFYMEMSVLILALAGIPLVLHYRLLIPIVLVTFHFQFFYLYLSWRGTFFPDYSIAAIPLFIDVMAILSWMILVVPGISGGIRGFVRDQWGPHGRS